MHSVSQRLNLRHLSEPLGGTEGLVKTVGFKKTTESMWWLTSLRENQKGVHCHTEGQQRSYLNSLSLSGACHEDVAASTSRRQASLSIVRRLAVARTKLSGRRSSSTVLSQVCLGLPVLRRQSLGGHRMQARRARQWSWPVSAWHRWPKDKRRWRIVSDRRAVVPYVTKLRHWRQNLSNRYGGCTWDTIYPVHLSEGTQCAEQ